MTGLLIESILAVTVVFWLLFGTDRRSRTELGLIILVAIVVRVATLLVSAVLLNNPENAGFAFQDDRNYNLVAEQMVDLLDSGRLVPPDQINYQAVKNQGYYYVNAALYWLFGSDTTVGSVFNIFVSALSIFLVYRIGETTWSREVGVRAAWLVALLPDMAFWTGWQFKDATVGLLALWSVYNLQRVASGYSNPRTLAGSLAAVLLMYTFRAEATFLLAVAFLAALMTNGQTINRSRMLLVSSGTGILAVAGALVYAGISGGYFAGAPVLDQLSTGATIEAATLFASMLNYYSLSSVDSAGLVSLGYIFGIQDLWRLPIALLFVVLIPFPPWPRGNLIAADLINVASIPWLVVMPLVLTGMFHAWRERIDGARVMLYYLSMDWMLLGIFLFAFNPSRHRIASVPLMLLFASAYWPQRRTSGWWIWMISICGMLGAMLGYLLLL